MVTKKHILVIEDEPTYQIILTQALASKFTLKLAQTIEQAKAHLKKQIPDLILLDFYLPDGNAFDLLKFLSESEKFQQVPIILITQESSVDVKVRSFSEGIYDFVTKPFSTAELLARIESHLSRSESIKLKKHVVEQFGDLVLEIESRRISIKADGLINPLDLSPIEFKILHFLMNHGEKVKSREQLALAVWNRRHFQSRTIDRHMSSIRKKLGQCSGYLQTVTSGGYRLSTLRNETRV